MSRLSLGCLCAAAATLVALPLVAASPFDDIRGCDGERMVIKRNTGRDGSLMRRQTTLDWQQQAAIQDPNQQCAVYAYGPVLAQASSYPAIWQIANLSQSGTDPVANQLFQQINASIPNIPVKGTSDGNFTGFTPTYSHTDPDCWWTYSRCNTPKLSGLSADVSTCPEPSTWGLTLDDGPNCSHNAYYDYLQQANQRATLFYIGSNVVDWPLQAQRGIGDGHEICAHTWSHRYMTALTNEQAFAELYFSKKAIKDVLGMTVQCWRPPFGDVDDRIRYIATALGMTTILWSQDVNDFRIATLGQAAINANYQNVIQGGSNGTYDTGGLIVLSHELNNATMQTSQNFLPQIQSTFKHVAPVAVCLNNSNPYVEGSAYTYPNFAQWAAGARNASVAAPTASANAAISIPLSSGVTSVASATANYASPSVTTGVSGAPSGSSSGSSSGGSTSGKSDASALLVAGRSASVVAAFGAVGAVVGGALAVL